MAERRPMTDIGGTSGELPSGDTLALALLTAGTNGDILTMVSGVPAWSAPGGGGWRTGDIKITNQSTPESGWLLMDGSNVSRTTYSALFTLLGTTWGAGNGSTTFGLPPSPGRFPIGVGSGSGLTSRAFGATGGAESHTLTGAQSGLPSHTHDVYYGTSNGFGGLRMSVAFYTDTLTLASASAGGTSASQSHPQMPPFFAVYFHIKT